MDEHLEPRPCGIEVVARCAAGRELEARRVARLAGGQHAGLVHARHELGEVGALDDAILAGRAPYDLIIANILAGPLLGLAGDFADAVRPGGQLLLAGLLTTQEPAVRAAYRTAGFRLAARLVSGDWSILWLRRRFAG